MHDHTRRIDNWNIATRNIPTYLGKVRLYRSTPLHLSEHVQSRSRTPRPSSTSALGSCSGIQPRRSILGSCSCWSRSSVSTRHKWQCRRYRAIPCHRLGRERSVRATALCSYTWSRCSCTVETACLPGPGARRGPAVSDLVSRNGRGSPSPQHASCLIGGLGWGRV